MASVECNKSLLRGLAENVHTYGNSDSMTLQLWHDVPAEVDLAATSFKAAVALSPGDALAIDGELLTAGAAQPKPKT